MKTPAWAALAADRPLEFHPIERREVGAHDVQLEVLYSGICHSDVHQARGEWGASTFPMVPGHEIIGRVTRVGASVKRFAVGDLAGVGCMVDSCRACEWCERGFEQFCEKGCAFTYNSTEMDRKTPTQGGYSRRLVVTEKFALKVPAGLDPAAAAPLLCAGVTTWSPLKQFHCKPGDRVAVSGLGGLGHMAVKLAVALGAEVTVLSTSAAKQADSKRLGATGFEVTSDRAVFKKLSRRFDLIVDCVSAPHDLNAALGMLRPFGALALVGAPPRPLPVAAFSLIGGNRKLAGSSIGSLAETQEVLDFCAQHKLGADVEVIPATGINAAYERMLKSDVRYRFVIDGASFEPGA